MNENNYLDRIKGITTKFVSTLNSIELISNDYADQLYIYRQKSASIFDSGDKNIALLYYEYISKTTRALYEMEEPLSSISKILVCAEKAQDVKSISLCESLLASYDSLKSEFGEFAKKCEAEIGSTKGYPSLNMMSRIFDEFQRKNIYIRNNITSFLN